MRRLFLNERFIIVIIVINAVTIFLQEAGVAHVLLSIVDALCTVLFAIEMVVKHMEWGVRRYWGDGWNRMDGALVILSLPSLVAYMIPELTFDVSFLLILRVLRVFRFFRIFHLFPNFGQIMRNVKIALNESFGILVGIAVMIVVFALISCSLFKSASPQYFGTPLTAIYSIFRLCTIEGWYEIPDAVAVGLPVWAGSLVKVYFSAILLILGIFGMSILNSIFVDAMVSDNNDEVLARLDKIEKKLDEIGGK